jgi:hypothetical protein
MPVQTKTSASTFLAGSLKVFFIVLAPRSYPHKYIR